jgi:xanthine dehydrogenase YagS FAD-binding subunit
MNLFTYIAATSPKQAVQEHAEHPHAAYLGGGTNLLDDMKLGVERPDRLIDVRKLGLDRIEGLPDGGLRIGAGVTNSALAYDERVGKSYPVLSQAILSGASPQLRNAATTAGNLLQRTRCTYFRDTASPCNKREPGSGCAAIAGVNRSHAVLGTSERCIATHPSDMDVALMALEAVIRVEGPQGPRSIPIGDFYVAYGEDPAKENVLMPGELITHVDLPATRWFARSAYRKARDRASYEFALASAAVALDLDNGVVRDCRIALGGVATRPWRALAAEQALRGAKAGDEAFRAAADAELKAAVPQKDNAFKIELCRRIVVHSLKVATAGATTA